MLANGQDHPEIDQVQAGRRGHLRPRALHRWLEPHLADDERVEMTVVGAHHGHRGLLVLSDRRVLVVADPSSGAALEVIPRVEVTSVEWARHGSTGSLTVRAGARCAVLAHVRLDDGPHALRALDDAAGTSGRGAERR